MSRAFAIAVVVCLLTTGCTKAPTQPSVGSASIDQFTLAVEVQGSVPYTFSLSETTNVAVTLASVVDASGAVSKAALQLSVGTESTDGTTCTPVTSVNTASALKAQIVTTLNPGSYCVSVSDIGNLTDTATVVGRIIHNTPVAASTTPATKTDTFTSNIAAGGAASRTFYVSQPGSASIALQSLSPTSTAGLAVGVPGLDGNGCNLQLSITAAPGSSAQIVAPVDLSSYCVKIFDAGGLAVGSNGLASFTISIVHP